MTPEQFSALAEPASTSAELRKLIRQWIDANNVEALAACIDFCRQKETGSDLGFAAVFAPEQRPSEGGLPLFEAVVRDRAEMVRMLLKAGCGVDARDEIGYTPLSRAFSKRALSVVPELIAWGADIHAETRAKTRVFDMVLSSGADEWVTWFLEKCLSVHHTNDKGVTCLHWACESGHVGLIKKVHQETGIGFSTKTVSGKRPLDFCSTLEAFKAIVEWQPGIELDIPFRAGGGSLLNFTESGYTDIVCHLLEQGADPLQTGSDQNTLMHLAVKSGEVALVQALIRRKLSVEGRNRANYRPLHWAASHGKLAMVKALVEEGRAKVNVKTNRNFIVRETQTPLYLATAGGHGDVARYLVSQGADVNAVNDDLGRTAVEAAAEAGDVPLLRHLLEHGGSPNGVGRDPSLPPRFACFPLASAASAAVVDTLIEFGADLNAESRVLNGSEGALRSLVKRVDTEALETARGRSRLGVIEALLRHGVSLKDDQGPVLPDARCPAVTTLLLAAEGARARVARKPVKNALGKAEREGSGVGDALFDMIGRELSASQLAAFSVLLREASKDEVNRVSKGSRHLQTILHRLLEEFRPDPSPEADALVAQWATCVEQLLATGADPNARETWAGDTPLHTAARAASRLVATGNEAEMQRVFQGLLDAGADPQAPNAKGANAIDLLEHPQLIDWFKARGAVHGPSPQRLFECVEYGESGVLIALMAGAENRFGLNPQGASLAEAWAMAAYSPANWPMALEIADSLMQNGFRFDTGAGGSADLLIRACSHGALLQAEWLLDAFECDLNAKNRQGDLPLGLLLCAESPYGAADMSSKDFKARRDALAVKMVERGARLDMENARRENPLALCPTEALRKKLESAARRFAKTASPR